MKACKHCGLEKPLEAFAKDTRRADGLQDWCKVCRLEYNRAYRAKHRAKNAVETLLSGRMLECATCHHTLPEEQFNLSRTAATGRQSMCKACKREHYLKNRDKALERAKQQHLEHRDDRIAAMRAYYRKNRKKLLEKARVYYQERSDKLKLQQRIWRYKNRAASLRASREYYIAHRDEARWYNSIERTRALGGSLDNHWTVEQLHAKLEKQGYRCAYCAMILDDTTMEIDHRIPLSVSKDSSIDNVVPCCNWCNAHKGLKTAEEWLQDPTLIGRQSFYD